ncbi:MAG: DUF1801 domain-containing protein [Erysipelothrix sp.]|nr:DUF1801 domain-containing protein [Erysipelothrix sp.]
MKKEIRDYIESIDPKRRDAYIKLLDILINNMPEGFELEFDYGMPGFVVPFSIYPDGYHTDPTHALPFLALGVQKGHIGLYHLGIYSDPELLKWFQDEYAKVVPTKLNMGKSCIRFTNVKNIPYELIEELVKKMSVKTWIENYENSRLK